MGSKLVKLDTEVRIPYDEEALLSGDPVRTTDYFLELVKTLQEQFENITITSNYTVDIVDGEAIYFALRGSDGEYPNGTWRRIQIGNNLELQRKVSGSWLSIQIREPIDGVIDTLLMDIAIDENKLANLAALIAAALELGVLGFLDSVDTGQIVNNAVTQDKLDDLSVTLAKLADNAVSSDKIIDTAVTEDKLAALSVSLGKMAADSVDKDKLTVPGVDADGKLVLGQIGSGDADNIDASATRKWAGEAGATVDQTGAEIKVAYEVEANAYTDTKNTKLSGVATSADVTIDNTAANVTGQGALATLNTVDTAQIDNDAITASKILALEIGTGHLAALAVTAGKIAALAIETDKLAANAVTAAKIAAGTITATEIASLTILADNIVANTITGGKIAALTIEAGNMAANAIIASKLYVVGVDSDGKLNLEQIGTGDASNITGAMTTDALALIASSILPNWRLDMADLAGRPAGIYPTVSIADFSQLDWLDGNKAEIKILSTPDTGACYGFPAIPIDDKQKYAVVIRHKSSVDSADGLYLEFSQYNAALPVGKTHIGTSNGGANVRVRTNFVTIEDNAALPGTSWVVDEYTYTPTAGTKYASLGLALFNPDTAEVEYHIDYVLMYIIPKTADEIGDGTTYGQIPKVWKHSTDVTKIDGGKIYTKSITAAVGAIGDLAVDTLQIANEAVTLGVSAYTDGSGATGDIISISIDATGQPVNIIGTIKLRKVTYAVDYTLKVFRDAEEIYSTGTVVWVNAYQEVEDIMVTIAFKETPSSGTYVYKINLTGGNVSAAKRFIHVQEVKK